MEKKYKIDGEIYMKEKIEEAIIDFKEVSKIELNNNTITVTGDTENEIGEVFNEFMNYNIGLINE